MSLCRQDWQRLPAGKLAIEYDCMPGTRIRLAASTQYGLGSTETYQNGRPAAGHVGARLILRKYELEMGCKIGHPLFEIIGERSDGAEGYVVCD